MTKPKALILTGYGINCDYETEFAFNQAGARAERVHINDLILGQKKLSEYQILAFPGGFSYGDDIGGGKVLAIKTKTNLGDELERFIEEEKLIIGVCNGFQAMVKYGLLPALNNNWRTQANTLSFNDSGRFEDRWVYLKRVSDKCIFTRGIERIYLPIAHGEGKFFAAKDTLKSLNDNQQVVFKYSDEEGRPAGGKFPFNPNGSLKDIAAICDVSGRIFGIMPHPERFLHFTNHPRWPYLKERLKRKGKSVPEIGDGLKVFQNAVDYFE
jgi:phosphoribosylformylglycinamidine synthase I